MLVSWKKPEIKCRKFGNSYNEITNVEVSGRTKNTNREEIKSQCVHYVKIQIYEQFMIFLVAITSSLGAIFFFTVINL